MSSAEPSHAARNLYIAAINAAKEAYHDNNGNISAALAAGLTSPRKVAPSAGGGVSLSARVRITEDDKHGHESSSSHGSEKKDNHHNEPQHQHPHQQHLAAPHHQEQQHHQQQQRPKPKHAQHHQNYLTYGPDGWPRSFTVETEIRGGHANGGGAFTDLVVVLDKSYSMRENDQLELAKKAVETIISHFSGEWDRLSVLSFDDYVQVVLPLSPLKEEAKEGLIRNIKGIALGRMTNIQSALEEALKILDARTAEEKKIRMASILLLTDGSHSEKSFSHRHIEQLFHSSQCSSIYCLALGREADQPFLFHLAERYGGQAAFIDTKHNLRQTLAGTFFRFFGALSSVTAKDVSLQLTFTTPGLAQLDMHDSHIPGIYRVSTAAEPSSSSSSHDDSWHLNIGTLMSEQRLHFSLRCPISSHQPTPPRAGMIFGELVLTYTCTWTKELKKISTPLLLPAILSLSHVSSEAAWPAPLLLEKIKGGLMVNYTASSPGDILMLGPEVAEKTLTTVGAGANWRFHLPSHKGLLEALPGAVLRVKGIEVHEGGHHVLSTVLETGKLYVEASDKIEIRRVTAAGGKGGIKVLIRLHTNPDAANKVSSSSLPMPPLLPASKASSTSPPPPPESKTHMKQGVAVLKTGTPVKTIQEVHAEVLKSIKSIPAPVAASAPSLLTPTLPTKNHRCFIDAGSSPSDPFHITCVEGSCIFTAEEDDLVSIPPLWILTIMKGHGRRISASVLKPVLAGKKAIAEYIGSGALAEELGFATRIGEQHVLEALHGLIEKEKELFSQAVSKRARTIEAVLDPVIKHLAASQPRAFELVLMKASETEGGDDLKGLTLSNMSSKSVLELLASQHTGRVIEALQGILSTVKDVEKEILLGKFRQLAQIIEQERAIVDGPESTLHTTASQRSYTIKGLHSLGLETHGLVEKYQQLFNEDFERLIAEFDNSQNLKRDKWNIPIGIVHNRTLAFGKRATPLVGEAPSAGGDVVHSTISQVHPPSAPPSAVHTGPADSSVKKSNPPRR